MGASFVEVDNKIQNLDAEFQGTFVLEIIQLHNLISPSMPPVVVNIVVPLDRSCGHRYIKKHAHARAGMWYG